MFAFPYEETRRFGWDGKSAMGAVGGIEFVRIWGGREPLRSLDTKGDCARKATGLEERTGDCTPVKNCWGLELEERPHNLLARACRRLSDER